MLYTVVGDVHCRPDNLDKVETLFSMVEDLGNPVIWLGDLLDTKEVVRGRCLNTYLRRFEGSNLEHVVLVGNHDLFHVQSTEHSLEALKRIRNVKVVDKPLRIDDLVFFPYTYDVSQFKAWLEKYSRSGSTLFCHADIKDFDYGNGHISKDGMDAKDFLKLQQVISGHYHKYQKSGNITYLGTPFSHSFGESNQEKYIGIFNSDTGELELIETPFPRHVTLEIDAGKVSSVEVDSFDYTRVILSGTQEEIDRFQKIEGIKFIERPTNISRSVQISETETPLAQFETWARDIKGYSEEIMNLGRRLLEDV